MMFARLDFPRFLVCCSGDLSDDESEEKPSVAICGGSIGILTGLGGQPSSSSSSKYCAGRRLTLHIRTLEVRPES